MHEAVENFLLAGSESINSLDTLFIVVVASLVVAVFGAVSAAGSGRTGFAVLGIAGTATFLVTCFVILNTAQDAAKAKGDAIPAVVTALEVDYGIELDELTTEKLLAGDAVAAKVDDEQLLVTLQEDTDDFWRLYSNGAALPLLTDEASPSESE